MTMHPQHGEHALARALAAVIAANGRVDERELSALAELGAFERMGVTPEQLVRMARDSICDMSVGLQRRRWLDEHDLDYIDERLATIRDRPSRLLLCRWAASVIAADGCITHEERLVYRHVLRRWGINHAEVSQLTQTDHEAS